MSTKSPSTLRASLPIGLILLTLLVEGACAPQPTTVPTRVPPTQAAPTQAPPSPTTIPPTLDPNLVSSLDEILGEWKGRCGGGPCVLEIRAEGKYRERYLKSTEGQGVTLIDSGKITISGNEIHLESTYGYCQDMPHGYYQASLSEVDGKPYLTLKVTEKDDKCTDREISISNGMPFYSE